MFTAQVLRRLWPHAPKTLVDAITTSAPLVFAKYGLNTDLLIAHAMAQFSHECSGGTIREENLYYTSAARIAAVWPKHFTRIKAASYVRNARKLANYVYEPPIHNDLGNRAGTDDGYNYRGRGGSQVTGRAGYARLGTKTGLDLLSNPDLVNEPQYWLECAVADFILCGCLPYAQNDDVRGVTRHLNGGYVGLNERMAWLARWKRALGSAHAEGPEDSLSSDEIRTIQTRLRDLGYHEVGAPDGKWGSRTTGALAAFQRHEMLTVTGHFDADTKAALDSAVERPVSPARAVADADDLKAEGSGVISAAARVSAAGKLKAGLGALLVGGGAGNSLGLLDQAQTAVDKAEQAKTLWGRVSNLIGPLFSDPHVLIMGLVLLIGGAAVIYYSRAVIAWRVSDHRAGIHAGPQG